VTETQTGFQLHRREQSIVASELRASLSAVHYVGDRERAELLVRIQGIALDKGKEALWAHALRRDDGWFLCGPDKASLRCGVRLGMKAMCPSKNERALGLNRDDRARRDGNCSTERW